MAPNRMRILVFSLYQLTKKDWQYLSSNWQKEAWFCYMQTAGCVCVCVGGGGGGGGGKPANYNQHFAIGSQESIITKLATL